VNPTHRCAQWEKPSRLAQIRWKWIGSIRKDIERLIDQRMKRSLRDTGHTPVNRDPPFRRPRQGTIGQDFHILGRQTDTSGIIRYNSGNLTPLTLCNTTLQVSLIEECRIDLTGTILDSYMEVTSAAAARSSDSTPSDLTNYRGKIPGCQHPNGSRGGVHFMPCREMQNEILNALNASELERLDPLGSNSTEYRD
jgi:hypothetical protein